MRDLLTRIATIDDVLDRHASELGSDRIGYGNHVYRVANLCVTIVEDRVELEKIAIAAVFHDIGIWTNHTFDYLDPSIAAAREHLAARGMASWIPEIEATIVNHHKITPARLDPQPLVEAFRRADWIDVTRGLRTFGLPRAFITSLFATWPSAGFHRRLIELGIERFRKHPLSPLPMVRF